MTNNENEHREISSDMAIFFPKARIQSRVELTWRRSDPFAVELYFYEARHPALWMLDRDVLDIGLSEPAGRGDVQVRPNCCVCAALEITLDSPTGRVVFLVGRQELDEFLRDTYAVVPAGTESSLVNAELDMVLGDWLGDAGEQVTR